MWVNEVVTVQEGRNPVDRSLPQPLVDIEALPQVQLFSRVDSRADFSGHPRTASHHFGDLSDPLSNGGSVLAGIVLVPKVRGRPARRGSEVELHALGRVIDGQLAEDLALEVADLAMHPSSTAGSDLMSRIDGGVAGESQAGEEVHALVVGAVDEHPERIEAALLEAIHVVPRAPVGVLLESGRVGAVLAVLELRARLGRIVQPFDSRHTVHEGVYTRARHLVDGTPGVFHGHRRLEYEEVVVPGVVEVDRALSSHISVFVGWTMGW